ISGTKHVFARTTVVNESNVNLPTCQITARLGSHTSEESLTLGPWSRVDVDLACGGGDLALWSAERPPCATLTLKIWAPDSKNRIDIPIGIRTTEVRGSELLINGSPVKLFGTCHHDSDPQRGRAITWQEARKDVLLIKSANLNALRTSH